MSAIAYLPNIVGKKISVKNECYNISVGFIKISNNLKNLPN